MHDDGEGVVGLIGMISGGSEVGENRPGKRAVYVGVRLVKIGHRSAFPR